MSWQNRIIGNDVVNPKSLDLNEKNWRKHPLFQEEALEGIMETIGWIQDVIVNKSTNKVVDGHLRIKLAIKHKQKLIPIKYVDLTQEEENIALATFDPIGAMAQAEQTLLKGLLEDVQSDNDKINALFEQVSRGYGALDSADISSVQPKDEEAPKEALSQDTPGAVPSEILGMKRPEFTADETTSEANTEKVKNACYFFVEFYEDAETYEKIMEYLDKLGVITGKHDIQPDFFAGKIME